MREQIAMRLHSRDRSIMKVLYESAPLNVSWNDLTWTQHEKYLKDADLYINDFKQEIEGVENPYKSAREALIELETNHKGERTKIFSDSAHKGMIAAFEDCRQAILERLK